MKSLTTVFLFIFYFVHASGQSQYLVFPDTAHAGQKVYKGILSKEILLRDTSFKWYADNQKYYSPMAAAVDAVKLNKDSIELLVFMGTWCEDSHFIIPRLYELSEVAGFDSKKITLIGTDRYKKTLSHLSEALNVYNVPTILIMKKGVEQGRIIEYGKYGMFEKDLIEILSSK